MQNMVNEITEIHADLEPGTRCTIKYSNLCLGGASSWFRRIRYYMH